MKKNLAKILCLVLAVMLMVPCFVSCGGDDDIKVPKFSDDTIKIGASGPLTGGASVYGLAVYNGARLAVSEINAMGGVDGVKLSFEMYDDTHDASKVEQGYLDLKEAGMQISLGCVTSGPCLEWSELSKEDNIFMITPSASNDEVPKYSNGYQMCFADGNQGKVAAEYVNSLNLNKIGIFYRSDDVYSKGIYDQFMANLNDGITTKVQVCTGKGTDFTTQVNALSDCEFIFMPLYTGDASSFMVQAIGKVPNGATYYGCDGFDGIESTEGFDISAVPQKVQMLSHFNSKATSGAAKDFADKYVKNFGKDTLNQFGAAAYDCVYAIYEALLDAKEAGKTVDGSVSASAMCELLKAEFNGDFTFSGATGTDIKWESTGYVNKGADAYVIKEANK